MDTCKDCLCYKACNYHIDEETTFTVNECGHGFLDKKQYIKLPAYVGQQVWLVYTWFDGRVEIKEGKVSMLQQKVDKTWKIRISCNGSVSDYTVEDFGNYVFLTREAAEAHASQKENELNSCKN